MEIRVTIECVHNINGGFGSLEISCGGKSSVVTICKRTPRFTNGDGARSLTEIIV